MRLRWVVVAVAVLLLVVLVVYYRLTSGELVYVAPVRQGPMHEFVDEQGKTRLPQVHLITMPHAGRILEVTLNEGDDVEENQVVAQISPVDLQLAVDEAKAAVERLSASLAENADISVESSSREQAKLFVESMVSTVEAAEARKTAGQSRLDFAETFLARVRRLFEQNAAQSREQLERAELQYVESQVEYQQDVLVSQAMQSILAATRLLPQMVSEYIARKSLGSEVLEKQKLEAQARLQQALLQQERGTLRSPVSGVVLNKHIENEQYLAAGTVLLEIGHMRDLEVEVDVLSEDVVQIQPGDAVEVYGPAVGKGAGSGLPGTVQRIFPSGFTKISSLGVEQQRVRVIVRLAPDTLAQLLERGVGVDFRVRARILTAMEVDALLVPRSALFRGPDGNWHVFVAADGQALIQPVEVGLMNDDAAQIVNGLQEGQQVILSPENSLEHGSRIRTQRDEE